MAVASLFGFGVVVSAVYSYNFPTIDVPRKSTEVAEIGKGLLSYGEGGFILPFEVISILLLAALIGAIIMSKGKNNI
jgi:NADH-quinone oxidoreductase subunit J